MKKRDVLDLIKYHTEHNEDAFRTTSYRIAESFDRKGDTQLAEYILSLISGYDFFSPQESAIIEKDKRIFTDYKEQDESDTELLLPDSITREINGILMSIKNNRRLNTYIFYGSPGTGKTQTVKELSRILNFKLEIVNFNLIIDSKLGQTSKNLAELFEQFNNQKERLIVLFDEIDALAMNRIDMNDLREMGRVTTALMKGIENLNNNVYLFATTNLYEHLDQALIRRFDVKVDFNRYSKEDLLDLSKYFYEYYADEITSQIKDFSLFEKIISLYPEMPYPADLKNLIKVSFAFSDNNDQYSHLKILYKKVIEELDYLNIKEIKAHGFTLKELELLIGVSKSTISREVNKFE